MFEKEEDSCGDEPGPAMRTPVSIDVTPLFGQHKMMVCEIDPASGYHKGGNITLPKGSFTLQFDVVPGPAGALKFDPDKNGVCQAFWSDPDNCPTSSGNAPGYAPKLTNSTRVEVDVDNPPGSPSQAVHYRLNFDNGCNFDPIIIHT